MRDILHDEKDALEEIQERWRVAVEQLREQIAEMATEAEDWRDLFTAANVALAETLAELTTEAAKLGIQFGEKKATMKGEIGGSEDHEKAEG